MNKPLLLLEGIFAQNEDGPSVHDVETHLIARVLESWVGRRVEAHLHHFPSDKGPSTIGGGSCLWGGHCPHGHRERPGWLFSQKTSGVLSTRDGNFEWFVGGDPLRFDLMPGHYGRLIFLDEDYLKKPDPEAKTEDLIKEAQSMIQFLTDLQKAVK